MTSQRSCNSLSMDLHSGIIYFRNGQASFLLDFLEFSQGIIKPCVPIASCSTWLKNHDSFIIFFIILMETLS